MNQKILGRNYRITVLTTRLLRLEYSENGLFTDERTQAVIDRNFEAVPYEVKESEELLTVTTKDLTLYYNKKPFSPEGLSISLKKGYGVYGSNWTYGERQNTLGGTARTLDNSDGSIPLDDGILSRDGYAVYDDSQSALLLEDDWPAPRPKGQTDLYFFGYGHDYLGALKDFYQLCGKTPLLPRFALGNWWSRFYPYRQGEYLDLMKRFKKEDVPLAVSVLDMDWHETRLPERYGSGWTGYSWNKELIPDPVEFLKCLHDMGLRVTLNLHPADGVKGHEEYYLPMAKELAIDYEKEERIPFDVTSKKFMECYFKYLHHPREKEGVDFWWIDWQQGSVSKTPGLDPLWMLNSQHYRDSARNGKRGLIFSRYSGIGSHRYPIGFSGDTVNSWASLDFQPYFTVTASNVGYTWWSHDIGGHMKGEKDDALATRWIQFGVFSPIMRLHATSNPFYGKEPWNYSAEAAGIMERYLRLRHRLIPYLYTANYRTAEEGLPLMQPLYYRYDEEQAYRYRNEYYFGEELLCCPITSPQNDKTGLGKVKAYLPEGIYYDIFTRQVYQGGRELMLYRTLENMPVFARAGSILPLAEDYMDSHRKNPEEVGIYVFHGEGGAYRMIEDDCTEEIKVVHRSDTCFNYQVGEGKMELRMRIEGANFHEVIPKHRVYQIHLIGCMKPKRILLSKCVEDNWTTEQQLKEEEDYKYYPKQAELTLAVTGENLTAFTLSVEPVDTDILQQEQAEPVFALLNRMQIGYDLKNEIYRIFCSEQTEQAKLSELYALEMPKDLYGMLLEQLTSYRNA